MRRVLIIGAGGIGSFLIPLLYKTNLYTLTVYNHEKVEVVKKDTNRTRYKDWNDIASDWILY